LEGSLSSSISNIYDFLINAAGDLEAGLDFPEEEMPPALMDGAIEMIKAAGTRVEELLGTWEEGHLLREGALVVISGKPNVGKSTLLNCLLGTNRAIVAAEPGTTRDTIEEDLILDGVPLRLVDTAGLRNTESVVEREGVQRARALIQNADINIHVYDCSTKLDGTDLDVLTQMDTRKSLIILNKTDLGQKVRSEDFPGFTTVPACLTKDQGLEDIRKVLADKIGSHVLNVPHATISERHRNIIQIVQSKLNEAIELLSANKEDMIVPAISALRSGIETLGLINGKTYDKALLDNIFSRFCIGK
jgi:tRNA modification GTPase